MVAKYIDAKGNDYGNRLVKNLVQSKSKTKQISKGSDNLSGAQKHNFIVPCSQKDRTNDEPLSFNYRFQVLAQLEHSRTSSQSHCGYTNASFNLKGNKNGKGQILGSSMHTQYHKSTQYNLKNAPKEQEHACLIFRGSTNEKGKHWAACLLKTQKKCEQLVSSKY